MSDCRFFDRLACDVPLFASGALEALIARAHELHAGEHPMMGAIKESFRPQVEMVGDVAVIPVHGALAQNPSLEELLADVEDTEAILDLVQQAAGDSKARGILLDVDSPGGFYTGGPEVADAVAQAATRKPVVAWTGGMMASLAYMIGSQAREVVASRSAQVGSIGVLAVHVDRSKMLEALGVKAEVFRNKAGKLKAPGVMGTALTEDHRAHLQERVETAFSEFKELVRRARPAVGDDSMQGQVWNGIEAKQRGLVDRVGSRNFALDVVRSLLN